MDERRVLSEYMDVWTCMRLLRKPTGRKHSRRQGGGCWVGLACKYRQPPTISRKYRQPVTWQILADGQLGKKYSPSQRYYREWTRMNYARKNDKARIINLLTVFSSSVCSSCPRWRRREVEVLQSSCPWTFYHKTFTFRILSLSIIISSFLL